MIKLIIGFALGYFTAWYLTNRKYLTKNNGKRIHRRNIQTKKEKALEYIDRIVQEAAKQQKDCKPLLITQTTKYTIQLSYVCGDADGFIIEIDEKANEVIEGNYFCDTWVTRELVDLNFDEAEKIAKFFCLIRNLL